MRLRVIGLEKSYNNPVFGVIGQGKKVSKMGRCVTGTNQISFT